MATDKELKQAKAVFSSLCDALNKMGWKYKIDEEKLRVSYGVNGDDLPMDFVISCDAERQLVRLHSVLSYKFPEDKRVEGAIAVNEANYKMAHGCFDYDLSDGMVVFRLVNTYNNSLLGYELFEYMVNVSASTVDRYNDLFFMLGKGMITLQNYMEKVNE